MPNIIELSAVSKKFTDTLALKDISFSVKESEVVGFVGANGAGKTTTINTLLGIISPTKGTAKLFGETVSVESAHKLRQYIGYASGDMQLPGKLTGEQYINFARKQFNRDCSAKLTQLVKDFKPDLDKPIRNLSRGNKQKIALITAFMSSPKLILLDEPTSGLDPVMQEIFQATIKQAVKSGSTVFMSSHYLDEVRDTCSRVILMRNGQIVRDLTAEAIKASGSKHITVTVGQKSQVAPKSASKITTNSTKDTTVLDFNFSGSAHELQLWISGIKNLKDIEIVEHDLNTVFDELYVEEEKPL